MSLRNKELKKKNEKGSFPCYVSLRVYVQLLLYVFVTERRIDVAMRQKRDSYCECVIIEKLK